MSRSCEPLPSARSSSSCLSLLPHSASEDDALCVVVRAHFYFKPHADERRIHTRAYIQADPGHIFAPGEGPIGPFPVRNIDT